MNILFLLVILAILHQVGVGLDGGHGGELSVSLRFLDPPLKQVPVAPRGRRTVGGAGVGPVNSESVKMKV